MEALKRIIDVCNAFKNEEYNIAEFQERLETIYLPDECKATLQKEQHNVYNELEEILYCYNESQKKYADEVADKLIQATLLEQKRLMKLNIY